MSEHSTKTPSKLRTFAADLEAVRAQRGDTPPSQAKEPEQKKTAEPTYAASPQPLRHHPEATKKDSPITSTETPKTEPVKAIPKPTINSIPPFHEIDKKKRAEAVVIKTAKSKEAAKTQPSRSRVNIGYDATVITDTKSNRFKLFPSILTSLQSWFKKITTKKKKATPKYVIPEAQRRKGVIQRAASKTGTIFTADNETLKEQIRRRQQQQLAVEDEAETNWSPYTETGYALLESPEEEPVSLIQNVQVAYKKTKPATEDTTPTAPAVVAPTKNTAPASSQGDTPPKTDSVLPQVSQLGEKVTAREKVGFYEPSNTVSVEAETHEKHTPVDTTKEEKAPVPTAAIPTRSTAPKQRSVAISRFNTNTLTILLLSSIIALVVFVVAARVVFQYVQSGLSEETIQTPSTTPVLRDSSLQEIQITTETIEQLPQLITTAVTNSSAGIAELSLVSPLGDEISPSYTFELLQFRTLPTFRQSLTTLRFVTVNRTSPAMLLQFTDRDTVRGGLLQWENTMAADFSRIHATQPQESSVEFVDEKIGSTDVRVLRSAVGVLLVYGFIGERTVLIANTTEDFAQISTYGPQ